MISAPSISMKVLTPEGAILEVDQLTSVSVPLIDGGTIGIKPGHAPLIAETSRGLTRFETETDEKSIELHPGVLDIKDNLVLILTAGEVLQTSEVFTEPAEIEFVRLMRTIVRNLRPQKEENLETGHDEREKRNG